MAKHYVVNIDTTYILKKTTPTGESQVLTQPAGSQIVSYSYPDNLGMPGGGLTDQVLAKASGADHDFKWVTGGGDMYSATYDPQAIGGDVFDRVNHTGTQTLATISDAGGAAALEVGTLAGTVAAGDHNHDADYAALSHTHTLVQITDAGNSAGLDVGTLAGTVAAGDHTHTGVYAASSHNHVAADVTDLGTAATKNIGTIIGTVAEGHRGLPSAGGTGQVLVKSSATNYDVEWADQTGGGGGMNPLTYDPQNIADDAFARVNHTGTQTLATISDAGNAASRNVGTGAGDVATGNHTHDGVYSPTSHTHTLADVTDSGGAAALEVGTTAGTVAAGDHTHSGLRVENGFVDSVDSLISFVDGTRTFTIQPAVTNFVYFAGGSEYIKSSAENIVIPDTEGLHFIYYDGTTLSQTQVFSEDIITNHAFVAAIYWDATNNECIMLMDERHGNVMSSATHSWAHNGFGTLWRTGLAITVEDADGNGDDMSAARIAISDGEIADEDIVHYIQDGTKNQSLNPYAQLPVYYRSGANGDWRRIAATDYPVTTTGSGRAAYNEWTGAIWQLTEVTNNDFLCMHIIATGSVDQPVIAIVGQVEYSSLSAARAGADTEINNLAFGDLATLTLEMKSLATLIFQTSNGYANVVKSRVRTTDTGATHLDWRFGRVVSGASSTNDHGLLEGLNDDDHTQYHNDVRGDARYSQLGHSHTMSEVTDAGGAATLNVGTGSGDVASGNRGLPALGNVDEVLVKTSVSDYSVGWANIGALPGFMARSVYDPTNVAGDAFARANHTGTQTLSTISDAGDAAGKNTGTAAGTVAAGDHNHNSTYVQLNSGSPQQIENRIDFNHYVKALWTIGFDEVYDYGNSGTSATISFDNGNNLKLTLNANCTLLINAPHTNAGSCFNLHLMVVSTGSYSITWPASVKWPGGTAPTPTASGTDIYSFFYDGTNFYGGVVQDFS